VLCSFLHRLIHFYPPPTVCTHVRVIGPICRRRRVKVSRDKGGFVGGDKTMLEQFFGLPRAFRARSRHTSLSFSCFREAIRNGVRSVGAMTISRTPSGRFQRPPTSESSTACCWRNRQRSGAPVCPYVDDCSDAPFFVATLREVRASCRRSRARRIDVRVAAAVLR